MNGNITRGRGGLEFALFSPKIPSVSAAELEMFAAAAGELVTAVTITAVMQATVQMNCTVMHPDAGPMGLFQSPTSSDLPSLDSIDVS